MNFQTSVKTCFKKYATFSGRASRSEFWYFYLFYWGLCSVLLFSSFISIMQGQRFISDIFFWSFTGLGLASLIPFFAVSARRLHDINKSGWFQILPYPFSLLDKYLIGLGEGMSLILPFIFVGLYIYLIVLYCKKGEKKKNKYGKPINT